MFSSALILQWEKPVVIKEGFGNDPDVISEDEEPSQVLANPNRANPLKIEDLNIDPDAPVVKKKVDKSVPAGPKPVLSRREKEAADAAEAKRRYDKLHEAGKTVEAKTDLARLEEVKKKREQQQATRLAEEAKAAAKGKKWIYERCW